MTGGTKAQLKGYDHEVARRFSPQWQWIASWQTVMGRLVQEQFFTDSAMVSPPSPPNPWLSNVHIPLSSSSFSILNFSFESELLADFVVQGMFC